MSIHIYIHTYAHIYIYICTDMLELIQRAEASAHFYAIPAKPLNVDRGLVMK